MKRDRFTQVGLDRLVRLAWLEKVARLGAAGNDAGSIKQILQEDMKGSFRTERPDVRGSIDKTITILSKVWLNPPPVCEPLRLEGLELIKHLPQPERLAVHWGMVMAVYPFWSSVAIQVGRLLRLQGTAAACRVQRRVREQYGERETVARRARYIMRSYLDWGVLQETEKKGIYSAASATTVDDPRLISWLTEASLHARANGSASLKDLIDSPSLFPFRIRQVHAERLMAASSRLEILRHGLDHDLVMLRKQPTK